MQEVLVAALVEDQDRTVLRLGIVGIRSGENCGILIDALNLNEIVVDLDDLVGSGGERFAANRKIERHSGPDRITLSERVPEADRACRYQKSDCCDSFHGGFPFGGRVLGFYYPSHCVKRNAKRFISGWPSRSRQKIVKRFSL